MKIDPSLFDIVDDTAEQRAEAREGRVVSHGAVRRWLSSWGTAKLQPRPRIGE